MSQGSRPERVGDLIRAELSALVARELRDPRVRFVTITYVRMSRDLQLARVHYTALDEQAGRGEILRTLRGAAPFLRRELARRLRLRRVPELTFVYDESIAREGRIAQVLEDLDTTKPEPE